MKTYVFPQRIFSLFLLLVMFVCLTPSLSAAAPQCKVVSNLNLRASPGTTANRLGTLAPNTTFEPLAVQLDAAKQPWFQVKLTSAGVGVNSGTTGWLIANTKWISCTPIVKTLVTTLPAAKGTAPTPPPPKKVAYTDLPNGGVGNEDKIGGKLRIFDGRETDDDNGTIYVFERQMVMQLEANYDNQPNGQGLRSVRFRIIDYNDPEHPVYEQDEGSYPYCLFGNQTSECEVIWDFAATGYRWPKTNRPIDPNTTYSAVVRAQASEGGNVSWDFEFRIQPPSLVNTPAETPAAQAPQLALAQTVLGSTDAFVINALAFQVVAFDPSVGSNDGDGIQSVDLWITGPNGEVHRRTEKTPGYCAFGGGEPDCNLYDFNEHSYTWPNGEAISSGERYTLHARANAKSGQQTEEAWFVTIQ